jgi:hypothetical protein
LKGEAVAVGERRIHPRKPLPGGLTWGEARAFVVEAVKEARQEERARERGAHGRGARGMPEARPGDGPEIAPPRSRP